MNFHISYEAQADLNQIWSYSSKNWGNERADLYIDLLMLRLAWLGENRGLWYPRPDLCEGIFSVTEKSHVIFFSESTKGLKILRILHGRMDPASNIRD